MSAGRFHHRGRLLAAGHLPRRLAGIDQVVVPQGALISPLVLEMLASAGIPLVREGQETGSSPSTVANVATDQRESCLLVVSEVPYELVERATFEFARGGKCNSKVQVKTWDAGSVGWGDWLAGDNRRRLVHFGPNPELVASVAMLRWAVPAASVHSVTQATRALSAFNPRLLAVEMPGRTLFEARHILGLMAAQEGSKCA